MDREENTLLTPLNTAKPALVPGLSAHGLSAFNPFGISSLTERTLSSDLGLMNGTSAYSPSSSPSPSNAIGASWPKHRQSPQSVPPRDLFTSKSSTLPWASPVPPNHHDLNGTTGQFEAPLPQTPQTLDMIVLQLEKFGIRLTPEQKMLKEQYGKRAAESFKHHSPMSPTLGESSFLAPNLKHMNNKSDGESMSVFPSAHDFDGFSNGNTSYSAPVEKRGKSSWDSGTSSSIGSPNSNRPVKPIGPMSNRPAGSGFPSPGSIGQDRPKQKHDQWGLNMADEGSTEDLSNVNFIGDNLRRRVESLLASDDPDELDFTEDIKDAKKRLSEQKWNIENYGAARESPPSTTPPYHHPPPPKTLKDVIASNNTASSEKPSPAIKADSREKIAATVAELSRRDSSDHLQGHELIQAEQTGILNEKLAQGFKFARICSVCFLQRRVGFDGFDHLPPPGHQCAKNVLVVRSNDSKIWKRVRNMPHHIDYRGPFLLCRHISQNEACPYNDACTFCYNEEEKEIWSYERRGLFNRTRLFTDPVVDPIAHFLRQYSGFFFTCNGSHLDDPSACNCTEETLYYQSNMGQRPNIIRDTPDGKTMELCRYSSTNRCNRGDHCYFAHSMVELDAWRIFVSHGVLPDEILATANSLQSPNSGSPAPFSSTFNFKHKWICSSCHKNGQTVERKGKTNYCSLPRNSHSWRDPLLYVYIEKWSLVRDLLTVFNKNNANLPSTFVVCKNIRDKSRCDYGEVCQFSHSDEECKVWNYMKENNIKGLKDLYKKVSKV
ncbi:Oidioi.mRNA.OKI2018_I69.XSR.g15966.t2.cds [Oikopleura dioica]|uniref:Oidioi.mRNA.OKI2018_I69.XSR.g15966.t2.cds n=1 Tax=Oikopleura dioica TaxID=34765 RepID=A0ABN7SNV8_OIKDI|nr:Oidioi.mRNA.OKI2018_I69.XSR.g15966.t2.cds [Oikopleura dioica]